MIFPLLEGRDGTGKVRIFAACPLCPLRRLQMAA